MELRSTDGSVDNLALLLDPASGVDFAFVRNGVGAAAAAQGRLLSLSGLFPEPVWVFYRQPPSAKQPRVRSLATLAGQRVNVGEPGSGVPALMNQLWVLNGIDPEQLHVSHEPDSIAIARMLDGGLDAVVLVSAPESPLVQMLLLTPGIGLLDLEHAEAYARRLPQVQKADLPRGIVDLARDIPPEDVNLVAATTMLVARKQTHPALRQIFVQVADQLHRPAGWFQSQGEFPTRRDSELPVDPEATRFYDHGQPLLQRYLPFGVANLIDRMWVVLVSLLAVLLPLSRVVPPLYVFRIRSRVFRWYGRLRDIEDGLARGRGDTAALLQELDQLDRRVETLNIPLAYAEELYALRSHIVLVRRKVQAAADRA